MTTRYRVEYALKTHRRDQFIEWIKGLLAVPFVLYSQPTGILSSDVESIARHSNEAHRRYAEILRDVEHMIDDHISRQNTHDIIPSKLNMLVPTAGPFFTRLPLEAAFKYQDSRRHISSRRYVSPSFNDVRLTLNSAQAMAVTAGSLQLATFDGDVTLYDDGQSLEPSSPLVPRILDLLRRDVKVGIVTAAGYTTADRYYERLHGLLDALAASPDLTPRQKRNVVVMGGEANYLFEVDPDAGPSRLRAVPRAEWLTPEMAAWSEAGIAALLDVAEAALGDCIRSMRLPAVIVRKDRAVGIIPSDPSIRIPRESLEETVLVVQRILELSTLGFRAERSVPHPQQADTPPERSPGSVQEADEEEEGEEEEEEERRKRSRGKMHKKHKKIPFCAFNGGRDVFVDIGDKSWGVTVCQKWFAMRDGDPDGMIGGKNTLHVGDQFLSAGSNDFKARSVGTTAWIASPAETVELLDELAALMDGKRTEVEAN
ncbi:IMP-specific 5-nucleotidase [Sodiomyces alkalinus F11]|uniref:IMP-specific 5'-nucleotidase 1 n=1 Tax=Sodiomyces alkalinus (strain CBS 110278 / VKM F-3762 / F11) TaxID=1314773 RepID=A0A3N2Q4D3_SODAK|nr:IMP-specific 5-nucleotidase [Sodiomyces alkalinus F11]ROT41634.1 IMP-specific 5-nucleotidase [Sodiomyces alkalinus F11]